jgi:AcrR family transcriptional regulator
MRNQNLEDRRVRKTKRALETGLVELLAEKEIQKVTVRELTEKVDIHRGTFYAHYADIYALYASIEERVISEISELLSKDYQESFKGFYQLLFDYLLDNKQICRFLFQGNANNTFMNKLIELFLQSCLASWSEEYHTDRQSEEIEYYARFYLSGGFAIINKWVESEFSYAVEALISMLSEIDISFGKIFKSKRR